MNNEMNDFKSAWQSAAQVQPALDRTALKAMTEQKAKGIFDVLRTNLRNDIAINTVIVLSALVAVQYFAVPKNNGLYYAVIQLLLVNYVPYIFFAVFFVNVLNQIQLTGHKLLNTLQMTLMHWNQTSKALIWMGMALSPAIMLSAVWMLSSIEHPYARLIETQPFWVIALAVSGTSLLASYYYKLWMEKMYGQHIDVLRECLRELEEE